MCVWLNKNGKNVSLEVDFFIFIIFFPFFTTCSPLAVVRIYLLRHFDDDLLQIRDNFAHLFWQPLLLLLLLLSVFLFDLNKISAVCMCVDWGCFEYIGFSLSVQEVEWKSLEWWRNWFKKVFLFCSTHFCTEDDLAGVVQSFHYVGRERKEITFLYWTTSKHVDIL